MDLDAVEAGLDGVAGGGGEAGDRLAHLVAGEHARGDVVLGALGGEGLAGGGDGGGADGVEVAVEEVGVSDPAGVHQLGEDPAAALVDGVGDLAPGGDLLAAVDSGSEGVALSLGDGVDALADDQAGGGALGVVLGDERGGGAADGVGPAAGHRGHGDAVGEPRAGEVDGVEGGGHGCPLQKYVVGQALARMSL